MRFPQFRKAVQRTWEHPLDLVVKLGLEDEAFNTLLFIQGIHVVVVK